MKTVCMSVLVGVLVSLALGCAQDTDLGTTDMGVMSESPCLADASITVVEGQPLVLHLQCGTGRALEPEAFEPGQLPAGATYHSEIAQLEWTPALDQAGDYQIPIVLPELAEHALVQVSVLDRFDAPDNVSVQEPRRYTRELGLPVVHLTYPSTLNADTYTPTTVTYLGREYIADAKYRGATSSKYPKRSYTLKFAKSDRFEAQQPGFEAPRRRIVLTSTFDDNSNLRQRLAFELWNRLDPDHIRIATYNAVLFVNGEYRGVYLVGDHVDEDLLDAHGMWRESNLYKARQHSADFTPPSGATDSETNWHIGYTKEEGEPEADAPDAYADLDALVAWVAQADETAFFDELDQRLRRTDFEDWLVFVGAIAATDSAGKNSYLCHDPRSDSEVDARWRYIPWDFNASFGQSYRTSRRTADAYPPQAFGQYNHLFERLLGNADARQHIHDRYAAALSGAWQLASVQAWLAEHAQEIAAASERDETKWRDAYRAYWTSARSDFLSHTEEVDYLREWLDARWALLQRTSGSSD